MKVKNKILTLSLITSLLISSTSLSFAVPNDEAKQQEIFLNRVNKQRAMDTIEVLSEDIGVRVAGSEEEYEAAVYLSNEFKKLGYDTEIQEFKYDPGTSPSILKEGNNLIESRTLSYSNTTSSSLSGELVYCGLGQASDFDGKDLSGKIALIERGESSFAEKAQNATNAGAIGVIIYNNSPGVVNGTLGGQNNYAPTIGISQDHGKELVQRLTNGEGISLSMEVLPSEEVTSWNVVASMKPWTKGNKVDKNDKDEIVYVTAHYDSVPKAPGANDNASGVASMLEIAKSFNQMDIDKEVRFIAFGAEEVGLKGSYAYVDALSQEEIDKSFGVFNLDMVATAYEPCDELAVYTYGGNENIVTDFVKKSGDNLSHKTNDFVDFNGDFDGRNGSSDHVPFDIAGIPSALFINVDPNGKLEPYYHQPTDITQNVSPERLERSIQLIGSAILDALNE